MGIFGRKNHAIVATEAEKYDAPIGPVVLAETHDGRLTGVACPAKHTRNDTGSWTGSEGCIHPARFHSADWWQMRESVYKKMMEGK